MPGGGSTSETAEQTAAVSPRVAHLQPNITLREDHVASPTANEPLSLQQKIAVMQTQSRRRSIERDPFGATLNKFSSDDNESNKADLMGGQFYLADALDRPMAFTADQRQALEDMMHWLQHERMALAHRDFLVERLREARSKSGTGEIMLVKRCDVAE